MGKPAATFGDAAAHGGTIALGSVNVRIGGRFAARQGDPVACPAHGPTGVIEQGSATVFINGRPAARQGDVTMCMASTAVFSPPPSQPAPPAVLGPETTTSTVPVPMSVAKPPSGGANTPPQVWSGSLGSSDKPKWENDLAQTPSLYHAESLETDANRNGQYDSYEGSAHVARLRTRGHTNVPLPVGDGLELGGTFGLDAAHGSYGIFEPEYIELWSGANRAEVGLMKIGFMGTLAPQDSNGANAYHALGVEANVLHANARSDMLAGDDGNRVGAVLKAEAGGELVKGDVYARRAIPLPGGFSIELTGKGGAAVGAAGIGLGGWAFFDREEDRFNIGALGKFEWGWGGRLDLNLSIGRETQPTPLPAPPPPPPAPPPPTPSVGLAGTIILGNPTVLIGG